MSSSDLAVGQAAFVIVPHNTTKFARRARAFYVGVGGDITVLTGAGDVVQLKDVPQGSVIPLEIVRVNATGTTASSLVGFA